MNHRLLVSIALVAVVLVPAAVSARSIENAPNEVQDPWFENISQDWYVEGQTWSVSQGNPGNLPGSYFDPGRNPGDVAFLRTIVDDYDGLWNPAYDQKEIDFSVFAHIAGGGYLKVRFDWWDDETIDRPSNDPAAPGPAPDGYTEWYVAGPGAPNLPGDFEDRPDLILPGEDPGWFTPDPENSTGQESFLLNIHEIWDHQPRWVSIEIEAGVDPAFLTGGEALITGVDFEAQCVPEPASLSLLAAGALAAVVRRKR